MRQKLTLDHLSSAGEVLDRCGAVLLAHEGCNTLLYAILGRLRRDPCSDAHLALVHSDGVPLACAAGIPGRRLAVSHLQHESAARLLAEDMAPIATQFTAVLAPVEVAEEVSHAVCATARVKVETLMFQRHFATESVTATSRAAGALRDATVRDRPLLEEWIAAFAREALGGTGAGAPAAVDRWLDPTSHDSGLVLWSDGRRVVSMAGYTGPTPTGITVLSVYTPPELRGRGYASACTAALTQRLLDQGRRQVFLSTDVTNPTSNAMYRRIGYRQLGDATIYRFSPAS